jgi:hypothetical protein
MDRLIALLAALVGLIALLGAVLVQVHGETERQQLVAELSQLRSSIGEVAQPAPAAASSSVPQPVDDGTAQALLALQSRVVSLEGAIRDQAATIAAAAASAASVATAQASSQAAAPTASMPAGATESAPTAIVADGPTKDCIPLGTRFMAKAGDDFAICKTKAVVKVTDVLDGSVVIAGAQPISIGGFGTLSGSGCSAMVFSSDTDSGYAEIRISCN